MDKYGPSVDCEENRMMPELRDIVLYNGEECKVVGTNSLNNTLILEGENKLYLDIPVEELDNV